MFWRSYRLTSYATINNEYLLSIICHVALYLLLMIMIIISASVTNELLSKVKQLMNNMPYRIPHQSGRIKCILRKNWIQDCSLTLWKVYIIDRSLILTSFGTLLTYGMLIGALGNSFEGENVGMKKLSRIQ
ncbi:uncharacterized protein NPIL_599351 [Nephila pilipes]|uniref:Uncharacterized protein n=1 Tax=Nephila pilipes TaxID=299642 RepID=A0A8X6TJP1_NEPPI|nr:uncharacterized protein NPIL_599351 [Nephila pilipes]